MIIDKNLVNKIIKITSMAAISAFKYVGKNDKISADKAAVDVMRNGLNNLDINGQVVIGEGSLDEAPMLYLGEFLGSGKGLDLDIAVDPVEGTNFVAKNLPGGLSVLAISEKGNFFMSPETYMQKIAVGPGVPDNLIDLDFPIEKNLKNLSHYKNKNISDLTACILDRPRHQELINKLKNLNVKLKLISDGDIAGALMVTNNKYNVDIFLGTGGGPEGVLAASALDAFNCKFQGRFLFKDETDIKKAREFGIIDLDKKYNLNEIVRGESVFCASGITDSELVKGVKLENNIYYTETLVTHKNYSINVVKNEIPNT